MRRTSQEYVGKLRIKTPSVAQTVKNLSGGNQQKVLLARALLVGPKVLIADEPTRGVDIGAKRAIYDFLVDRAADGLGVILISSEPEEILGLAHRVLVMRRGRIVAEVAGPAMTEDAILAAAFADDSTGTEAA
jgi:simple sugar transport system ATP-binding protein/ribose transport system ATP-binding protein